MSDSDLWKEILLKALIQVPPHVNAQAIHYVVRQFTKERTANNPYVDQSRCVLCHPELKTPLTVDLHRFRVGMNTGANRYSQKTYFLLLCSSCAQENHVDERLEQRQSAIDAEARRHHEEQARKTSFISETKRKNFENQTGTPASNYWYLQAILTKQDSSELRAMPYKEFLQTLYWKTLRRYLIYKRNGCELCNSTRNINIHHRTYEHRGSEVYHLGDLVVLCEPCHAKFHDKLAHHEEGLSHEGNRR